MQLKPHISIISSCAAISCIACQLSMNIILLFSDILYLGLDNLLEDLLFKILSGKQTCFKVFEIFKSIYWNFTDYRSLILTLSGALSKAEKQTKCFYSTFEEILIRYRWSQFKLLNVNPSEISRIWSPIRVANRPVTSTLKKLFKLPVTCHKFRGINSVDSFYLLLSEYLTK